MLKHPLACLAALTCLSLSAKANDAAQNPRSSSVAQPLTNAHAENTHLTGIGRLIRPGRSRCIASLLDTRTSEPLETGPAYVVTAGHCVDKRNGVIGHDTPIEGSVSFNYFADTKDQRPTFDLKRTVWSSMQGADLALLELDATLQEVMAQGVSPLELGAGTQGGRLVQVIGEASDPDLGLRLASCQEAMVPFAIEHPWVWRNLRGNDCPRLGPGASGSPVLDVANGRLVGVINSVAEASDDTSAPCSLNNPCQPDEVALSAPAVVNYSIPLGRLAGCFAQGIADLTLDSCQLLPGFQWIAEKTHKLVTKIATDAAGNETLPSWGLKFSIDTPRYRYKAVRDPLACEDPEGYSGTIPAAENYIASPIGPEPGWHFLCVIGVASPDQTPSAALMANSLSLAVHLLPAMPVPAPQMTVTPLANGNVEVSWRTDPPHLSRYRVKRGPVATTDCHDPSGFRQLRHERFVFKAKQLPLKLCTFGEDLIEQRSAVRTDLLEAMPSQG